MKVLFLTKYSSKGASSRYRSYLYEQWFQRNGIEPTYSPLFGDIYLEGLYKKNLFKRILGAFLGIANRILLLLTLRFRNYDFIVIEKELFPKFSFHFEYFFLRNIKYSLDFDDNVSQNYRGTKNENKIQQLMRKAKFVTVGNHWYLSRFDGNFIYLPTVVDMDDYPLYNNQKEYPLVVVWIGSPSTEKYLKIIEPILVRLSTEYDFVFRIIGGTVSLSPQIKTEYIKWSKDTENRLLAESNIGIMPLENTDWEKGKCGFKLIQYMASGIPVVASNLPANKEIVQENAGFIVNTEEEWYERLSILIKNSMLRKEMGKEGRKRVEKYYSYQVWGHQYSKILKENA